MAFSYAVQAGDNGALAVASPINPNGGAIQDGSGNNAVLTLSPPSTTGALADTTAPTVTISSPSATITKSGPITYTVTYSDANFNASSLTALQVFENLNKTGTVAFSSIEVTPQ